MIATMIIATMIIATMIFTLIVFYIICNQRTYSDRMAILNRANMFAGTPEFWVIHEAYDSVTYDQHLKYYLTFRDPTNLYPSKIQIVMGWKIQFPQKILK